MSLLGIHLTLLVGPTVPVPAPPWLLESLESVEVTHSDQGQSGFQITLRVGRAGPEDVGSDEAGKGGMMRTRQEQIEHRRAQIPKLYRGIYDKAVAGRSRKAAMHAFCLECCGYQIQEVYLCTDLGCPLYPYRPKSRVSPVAPESVPDEQESKKSVQRANIYG